MIGNCMIHIDHLPSARRISNRQQIRISARGPWNAKSGKPRSIDFRRKCGVYHGNEHRQMIGHCMLYIGHLPSTRGTLNRQQIPIRARAPCSKKIRKPLQATVEDNVPSTAARCIARLSEIACYILAT